MGFFGVVWTLGSRHAHLRVELDGWFILQEMEGGHQVGQNHHGSDPGHEVVKQPAGGRTLEVVPDVVSNLATRRK